MYERILFPTDGSEGSEVAKRHAENIAETYGSEVHVLYVADRSNEPSQYVMRDIDTGETGMVKPEGIETDTGYTAKGTGKLEALEQRGADLVGSVAERFADRGLAVTTAVLHGEPYKAITTYAAEQDADLIVMATHGRRGLDRYLLGSVTEKVVRTADVPVLTVRLQE